MHRREDFLGGEWPQELVARARELEHAAEAGLRDACQRLCGRVDADAIRTLRFAVVDAPLAAVLPHLRRSEAPPAVVDRLIHSSAVATLGTLLDSKPRRAARRN